jgi:hypothetical protein
MNTRTIKCQQRYKNNIKRLIKQGRTVAEIANKLKIDTTRVYADVKRFGNAGDVLMLQRNTALSPAIKNRLEQAKRNLHDSNYYRSELARERFVEVIRPLIWEGVTAVDIKNQLKLKARSAVARSVKKYGNTQDIAQLRHNGIVKKRDALLKLMVNKTSKPEIMLYNIVKLYYPSAQHKYKILSDKQYYWELDIAIPEIKLNLEYDGYYWHKDNKQRDEHRDLFLKKQGWRVIRFNYKASPTFEELERVFKRRVPFLLK